MSVTFKRVATLEDLYGKFKTQYGDKVIKPNRIISYLLNSNSANLCPIIVDTDQEKDKLILDPSKGIIVGDEIIPTLDRYINNKLFLGIANLSSFNEYYGKMVFYFMFSINMTVREDFTYLLSRSFIVASKIAHREMSLYAGADERVKKRLLRAIIQVVDDAGLEKIEDQFMTHLIFNSYAEVTSLRIDCGKKYEQLIKTLATKYSAHLTLSD